MNAPTNIQIIYGADGKPAFVVVPYEHYQAQRGLGERLTPHAVVERIVLQKMTPSRAWRERLGLTQQALADRLGITQSAYAQQEAKPRPRKASRQKIAAALGIDAELLNV